MDGGEAFIELRDRLLREGISHEQALQSFDWPAIPHFNWAIDYFDRIAAGNERPALRVVDDGGRDQTMSFAALARRSNQVANFLAAQGVGPGDRVLIMLGNVVALWETMLATMKLGAVMIPATTLLQRADLDGSPRARARPRRRRGSDTGEALRRLAGCAHPHRGRRHGTGLDRVRDQQCGPHRHSAPRRRRLPMR